MSPRVTPDPASPVTRGPRGHMRITDGSSGGGGGPAARTFSHDAVRRAELSNRIEDVAPSILIVPVPESDNRKSVMAAPL